MSSDSGKPSMAADLQAALRPDGAPETAPPDGEEKAPWRVTTVADADWALRKISEAERELAAATEYAEAYIAKIKCWLDREKARARHAVAFFEGELERYALDAIAPGQRKQSISTPSGKFGFRRAPGKIVVDNDGAVLDHLTVVGWDDCVRVRRSVDKAALKKRFQATGELVPGTTWDEGDRRFYTTQEGD